jgi:hypothetical protein
MEEKDDILNEVTNGEYKYGFVTDIDTETIPKGLSEEVVRMISAKKGEPEWMTEFRLKAYRHWLTMTMPRWPHLDLPEIDFQDIIYYAAPKQKPKLSSMDEVDPELKATFDKLGVPLEEQMLMKEASRINDETILKARDYVKPGMTEKQVAEYIDNEYKKAGCESVAFTTIVSFGANAADPHHEPDDTVLEKGECVLIDMGCCKNRYCSDMTRTFFCGEPKPEYAAIHDLVRQANEAAEAMIHPGVRLCDIDAAARDLITKAGYGEYFNHRLGHFIGQTDHEKGDVSAANTDTVKPGMIFSIEPGVYLPGKFGVRVEDLVIVTETGCEVLNHVDKHWSVVGV